MEGNDINISTKIGDVQMVNPLMNASGVMCTQLEDLQKLNTSGSGAFISKSCTLFSREGNPEPR